MEDKCVCCGAVIPEGTQVCPNCLVTVKREPTCKNCLHYKVCKYKCDGVPVCEDYL